MKPETWADARRQLQGRLSDEEDQIVALLAEGKTQRDIGARLDLHRSAVWRRVNKLKKRIEQPTE